MAWVLSVPLLSHATCQIQLSLLPRALLGDGSQGPPKQPSLYRRELALPCQACPRNACRTRQAGKVHYPLLSEEMLRTARQVTCPVSKLPSWDLNWGRLPPDPVPLPLLCIYAQGLGSRNDPQTNRVIPGALSFVLNSVRHPEWPHLILSL